MERLIYIIKSLIPSIDSLPSIASISNLGPGWIFGALGSVAVSLFGLSIGRTKTVISLLSIYIAFVLNHFFPYPQEIKGIVGGIFEDYWLKIGLFLVFYIITFFIFSFSFLRKRLSSSEYSLFGIIVLSFFQLGFAISIIFNMFPRDLVSKLSFGFEAYIATGAALFFWAAAPLAAIFFIRK